MGGWKRSTAIVLLIIGASVAALASWNSLLQYLHAHAWRAEGNRGYSDLYTLARIQEHFCKALGYALLTVFLLAGGAALFFNRKGRALAWVIVLLGLGLEWSLRDLAKDAFPFQGTTLMVGALGLFITQRSQVRKSEGHPARLYSDSAADPTEAGQRSENIS